MQGWDEAPLIGITAIAGLLPTTAEGNTTADAPRPVPLERWDMEEVQRGAGSGLEARFGAFVADADLFDAAAFNISR